VWIIYLDHQGIEQYATYTWRLPMLRQRRPVAGDAGPAQSTGGGERPRCRTGRAWWLHRWVAMQDRADQVAAAAAVALDAECVSD
jgi:hypothetical protein